MELKRLTNLLLLLLIVSCNNEHKSYYSDGKLKSVYTLDSNSKKQGQENVYYSSGELMTTSFYKDGVAIDSSLTYNTDLTLQSVKIIKDNSLDYLKNYKNNNLVSSGSIDNHRRPIGWWKFYSNGKVETIEERIIIFNKSVVNRIKNFKGKNIDSLNSRLFEVDFPLEVIAGKQYPIKIKFNFNKSESKNLLDNEYFYLLTSPQINDNFSNLSKVKLDTVFPLRPNQFLIMLGFRNPGKRDFRGIIERHTMIRQKGKLIVVKSQMFVNEKITVL